ncbi:MAG: helix-turn-helix transcriptional regulator [Rhizobiales bacterium]|nr:helix-turn-helix transcriptional regulator [Hyphomicrobiales bacterium]MBO6700058.1 helix-turn-helix transcriptional regulator [Hyphomicrobiales bacterium]MBO6737777.1 helix-turn-helix transcriptional regulator [Hyphomicrobiales bacterium]MBO6913166.1 helix-turn-helix transcriptional regulator [Hyphomicrobiales bacterium]MBO6954210.1 helix-turn-helix transcriptional regulator [Hyphomicrobiales bacterium]
MDILDATQAFAALSQPSRLDAYRLLVKAGESGLMAGQISDSLGVRQNTMSANLAVLLHAGLVRRERHGRTIRYFANFEVMRALMQFMIEDCCNGEPQICAPLMDVLTACDACAAVAPEPAIEGAKS